MSALVSVYITNYNYGDFIEQAIDSVLNQTLQDFELLIIDDGSTDNSKEIIQKYQDNDQITVFFQQNKGLNATNNVAVQAAKGKYIVRLDADDFFHPSALETMSKKLDSDDELGLVFPDYFYVDAKGDILGEERRHDFKHEVKLLDQPAHGACTMIRLDYLKKVGGYSEAYNCQDGYELWVKFTGNYKVGNVSTPLFYYRQHGKNLTGNEERILKTRASINADFVKEKGYKTNTLAIIPVRGGAHDIAFKDFAGKNLLARKIEEILKTDNVTNIVVTSPDPAVKDLINTFDNSEQVIFHERKVEEASYQSTLNPTISEIVNLEKQEDFEIIAVLTLEYPLLQAYKIDDVINTMLVFDADSIIGTRADDSIYYQHHGAGLKPILNRDQYTRLERDALFKQVGGISAIRRKVFQETSEMVTGKIGHTMMDQRTSMGLFSQFDWKMAEMILEKEF